ncbi:MAG: MBL fold metallo-hydrolase [Rubrivivax sp.]|nr:MAG: MBL fold metallo-hydrolase [Rubrivivax sp.]
MKKIHALVAVALAAMVLMGCSGVFRPNVDPSSQGLAYRQEEVKTPGLSLTFFGTSTVLLSDGRKAVMTDGFFSRPSWLQLLLTKFESNVGEIDFALGQAKVKKVDAILVAHSHHDHAMDAGLVAQKTGATVHGSESTLNIARGQKTPESQLRLLKPGQALLIGDFKVTAYETPHSPEPINVGTIDHPLHAPAKLSKYKLGDNFSFLVEHRLGNVLIVPSANYKPHAFDGVHAPVVVLGIGLLGKQSAEFTERYWDEVVRKTGAKLVLPVHWDDFARSLHEPLVPLPRFMDNMAVALERLQALAKRDGVAIRFVPALQAVTLPAAPH